MMVGEKKYAKMVTADRIWGKCSKLFSEEQFKGVNLDQSKQSILFEEIF